MTKISSSSARISVLTGISPEWKQTNFPTLCRLYYKQYLLHKRLCRKHSMTRNPKHKHPLPSLAMWKVYKSKCSKCQIRLLERRKWLLTNPPLPWHSDVERHVPWKYWVEILLWVEICFGWKSASAPDWLWFSNHVSQYCSSCRWCSALVIREVDNIEKPKHGWCLGLMPFFDHKLNNIFAEYFFYILAVVFDYLPREVLPCSSPSQSLRQWCYSQGLEENHKWLM